nr:hypothetical protein Iba_chr01cCG7080 [Ipomoea batatas]
MPPEYSRAPLAVARICFLFSSLLFVPHFQEPVVQYLAPDPGWMIKEMGRLDKDSDPCHGSSQLIKEMLLLTSEPRPLSRIRQRYIGDYICDDIPQWLAEIIEEL